MSAHVVSNPVPTPEEMAEILGVEPERLQEIREIMSPVLVERTQRGGYAVRKLTSSGAAEVFPTQAEAIKTARALNPSRPPLIERVRKSDSSAPSKWRRA
jgi:hypothetical protein